MAFSLYLLGGPVSCVFFRGSLHHHPMLLLLLLLAYSSSSFYLFKRRNYIPSSSSAAAYLVGSSCTYEYDRNVNIIRCTREEYSYIIYPSDVHFAVIARDGTKIILNLLLRNQYPSMIVVACASGLCVFIV